LNESIGIVCMACGAKGSHKMGGGVRLKDKRHVCDPRARPRPIWWVQRYPDRARAEVKPGARAVVERLILATSRVAMPGRVRVRRTAQR